MDAATDILSLGMAMLVTSPPWLLQSLPVVLVEVIAPGIGLPPDSRQFTRPVGHARSIIELCDMFLALVAFQEHYPGLSKAIWSTGWI